MKVYTTGQVAKICKVAPRTVSKWFDSGLLKGYRIPGSQDRRVPREYLIKFLKEHGMPLGELEDETIAKVLVVTQNQKFFDRLRNEAGKGFKIQIASSGFEAGIVAESFHPDCVVVDFNIGRDEGSRICRNLAENHEFKDTIRFGVIELDDKEHIDRSIVTRSWRHPVDATEMISEIKGFVGQKKELVV